jgi:hypothetical protein
MSRLRLSLVPSRGAARRLFLLSLLGGASACSSPLQHPTAGAGGAAGQRADAGPDSPSGAAGTGMGGILGSGGALGSGGGGAGGIGGTGGTGGTLGSGGALGSGGSGGAMNDGGNDGGISDAGTGGATGTGGASGLGGSGMGGAAEGGFTGTIGPPILPSIWQILNPAPLHKIDIVFMIDNSQSMITLQDKVIPSFSAFANVLKALPGGLPDLHLGVISSDTGPGKFDLPAYHCAFGGDFGRFQSAPRAPCTTSPLPVGQTFLQAMNDQQTKNYTGDIADAFACIAALGEQGCGFEGQLKSVRWALDPVNAPIDNVGFLRSDAFLVVVLVTNEDDCSIPDDSDLVDPTQTLMSSTLGPLWSWRCNEFGHLCQINGMWQSPARGPATLLQDCISNDGPTGKLTQLRNEVAFLKGLKSDQSQIMVAALTGPATPYSVEMIQQGNDTELHPNVIHSCTSTDGNYADPAVRITQWAASFGASGSVESLCADSFDPAMQRLGRRVGGLFRPACASGTMAASGQPACRVIDQFATSGATVFQVLMPNCNDVGNLAPCWSAVDDTANCGTAKRITVNRGPTLPGYVDTAFTCDPCAAGSTEIGCH